MASKIPPISKANYVAIAGMQSEDLLKVREAYIVTLVGAYRGKDSDAMMLAIEWIAALVSEMRLRGAPAHMTKHVPEVPPTILAPA